MSYSVRLVWILNSRVILVSRHATEIFRDANCILRTIVGIELLSSLYYYNVERAATLNYRTLGRKPSS